jgi:hypothetical protein
MNKLYSTMKTNVGTNIRDTSTAMLTIIGVYINDIYLDLLRRTNWQGVREDYSFTLTSQDQVLPDDFGKAVRVWDSTNANEITKTTIEDEVSNDLSNIAATGAAYRYTILERPVRMQPTADATLSLVSSSASDTTQTVRIRGLSSGVEVTEAVVLTGTTPAVSTNTYDAGGIMKFSKNGATVGKVTITSGTETIAIIPPAAVDYMVKIARFYQTPASGITVNMPYIRRPIPMSEDYDTPVIDCSDVLELGATMRALMYKRKFGSAQEYRRLYEAALGTLMWDIENDPNDPHTMNIVPYSRETA